MLSATYEIGDMKKELKDSFAYYDYDSQAELDNALQFAIEKTKREKMLKIIDADTYDEIEALDRTGLTDEQEGVYYAEVYYSLAAFFDQKSKQEWYKKKGQNESRSENKTSYSIDGMTGLDTLINLYNDKAVEYIANTPYTPAGAGVVRRIGSMHV